MTVKNHILDFEELITEIDHAIQTDLDFSNSKATPTNYVPDNSVISSNLIEVVVMDEDTVILNRDLMGKQNEQISPPGLRDQRHVLRLVVVTCKKTRILVRAGPKEVVIKIKV